MKQLFEETEDISILILQLLSIIEIEEENHELYLRNTIMRKLIWINLAEEIHLSKSYVSRIFHQETGETLVDYLAARRIKQACRLLGTTDLRVEQIGIAVGFPNAFYKKPLGIWLGPWRNGLSNQRLRCIMTYDFNSFQLL